MLGPLTEGLDGLDALPSLARLAVGGVLLLFGRRLFWLLLGAIGFLTGFLLADYYLSVDSEILRWVAGLAAGLAAALAALVLQRLAVSVAGALVAGYTAWWYLSLPGGTLEPWYWLLVVAAAAVGLLLARTVFDLGLIFVSSLAGAILVVEGLDTGPEVSGWLLLGLIAVGAAVQGWSLSRRDE